VFVLLICKHSQNWSNDEEPDLMLYEYMIYEVRIKIQRRIGNAELNYCVRGFTFSILHSLFVPTISLLYSDMSCVHSVSETFKVHCSSESELETNP
jgi:hypothetical protein